MKSMRTMGPFKKYVHSIGGRGYSKSVRKFKRGQGSSVFAQKKQCVYCNSFVRQNSSVQCSLNCEFGTYDVTKYIFILFNVNKVTQHVNYNVFSFGIEYSLCLSGQILGLQRAYIHL